jgi:hypothetical protein
MAGELSPTRSGREVRVGLADHGEEGVQVDEMRRA